MFHGPWYCDADAVHLVSRYDVEEWHRQHGYRVHTLSLPCSTLREKIYHRLLTLNLACQKQVDA
jgi:hypothetical protein